MTILHLERTALNSRGSATAGAFQCTEGSGFSREVSAHNLGNLLQIVSSGIRVVESRIRQGRTQEAQALLAEVGASMRRANALASQELRRAASRPVDAGPRLCASYGAVAPRDL